MDRDRKRLRRLVALILLCGTCYGCATVRRKQAIGTVAGVLLFGITTHLLTGRTSYSVVAGTLGGLGAFYLVTKYGEGATSAEKRMKGYREAETDWWAGRDALLRNQRAEANLRFQRSQRTHPRPEPLLYLSAMALEDGQRSEAIQYLRQALAIDPQFEPARRNLALLTGESQ